MDKNFLKDALKYIVSIPALLLAVIASLFTGHIWFWIIYTYYDAPPKSAIYLKSIWAKTGLGLLWYSLFFFPIYLIKFGVNTPVDIKITTIVGFTIILGFFVQAIAIIIIITYKKNKK